MCVCVFKETDECVNVCACERTLFVYMCVFVCVRVCVCVCVCDIVSIYRHVKRIAWVRKRERDILCLCMLIRRAARVK